MNKEQLLEALRLALDSEDLEQTDQLARQAVVQYPQDSFGYYFLAEVFIAKNNYENAEIALVKAIEMDETSTAYKLRFATIKELQGDYEDAEAMYGMILDQDPHNIMAMLRLGVYYLQQEQDAMLALRYLNQAIELDGSNLMAYCLRANAHLLNGNAAAALLDAQKALSEGVNEAGLLAKISALTSLGEIEKLDAAYLSLLEMNKENPIFWLEYARFLAGQEHWSKAEVQLRQLFSLLGEKEAGEVLLEFLAEVLMAQQKYADAIPIFDQWVAQNPQQWLAYAARAEARQLLGELALALADLRQAELNVSAISRTDLQLRQAAILLKMNDLREAGKLYQQASRSDNPKYMAEGYYGLGLIYHRAKNMEKAFESLQQAVQGGQGEAQNYLQTHFAEQLAKNRQSLLEKYANEIIKNKQSLVLQPLFAKIWRYEAALNPLPSGLPADIAESLHEKVKDMTVLLTERGLIVINPINNKPQLAVYKIETETEGKVMIEITAVDGSSPYSAQLQRRGEHLFFQRKGSKSAAIGLQSADSNKEKALLQDYLNADMLAFLGVTF